MDPRKQTPGGRHQIGIPAGFKSESVAGFLLECVAGFIGNRNLRLPSAERRNLKQLAKSKGGRPEEWFTLPDDVPCRDLPLEIETLAGPWQAIEQDDLKRRYEDLEVTLDDNGKVEQLRTRWRG